jgi:hypothetical protein
VPAPARGGARRRGLLPSLPPPLAVYLRLARGAVGLPRQPRLPAHRAAARAARRRAPRAAVCRGGRAQARPPPHRLAALLHGRLALPARRRRAPPRRARARRLRPRLRRGRARLPAPPGLRGLPRRRAGGAGEHRNGAAGALRDRGRLCCGGAARLRLRRRRWMGPPRPRRGRAGRARVVGRRAPFPGAGSRRRGPPPVPRARVRRERGRARVRGAAPADGGVAGRGGGRGGARRGGGAAGRLRRRHTGGAGRGGRGAAEPRRVPGPPPGVPRRGRAAAAPAAGLPRHAARAGASARLPPEPHHGRRRRRGAAAQSGGVPGGRARVRQRLPRRPPRRRAGPGARAGPPPQHGVLPLHRRDRGVRRPGSARGRRAGQRPVRHPHGGRPGARGALRQRGQGRPTAGGRGRGRRPAAGVDAGGQARGRARRRGARAGGGPGRVEWVPQGVPEGRAWRGEHGAAAGPVRARRGDAVPRVGAAGRGAVPAVPEADGGRRRVRVSAGTRGLRGCGRQAARRAARQGEDAWRVPADMTLGGASTSAVCMCSCFYVL